MENNKTYTIQLQIDGNTDTEKAIVKYLKQTITENFCQHEEIVYNMKIISKENLR